MKRPVQYVARYLVGLLRVVGAIVLLFGASCARADVLVLNDGESLTGSLTRIVEGILVFRTSLRGQMMLPVSEVRSLQTEDRWIIEMSDEVVHVGRFSSNGLALNRPRSEGNALLPLAYSAINSAKAAPPEPDTGGKDTSLIAPWQTQFAVGVQTQHGVEAALVPFAEWRSVRPGDRGELNLRLRFDIPQPDTVGDFLRANAVFWAAPGERTASYIQATIDRDTYDQLAWRTGLAIGLRYDFSATLHNALYGYLGMAGYHAQWRGDEDALFWLRRRETESTASLGIQLGLSHSRSIPGGGHLDSRVSLIPSLTASDSFHVEAESALSFPLTSRLHLRLELLLAYEDEPVFNSMSAVDGSLGAGIQFDF